MDVKGMINSLPVDKREELNIIVSICKKNSSNEYTAKQSEGFAISLYLKKYYSGEAC